MRKILTSVILTALIASTAFSQIIQEKTGSSGETKGKKILIARFKNDSKEYLLHASMVILSAGKFKGAYYAHDKNSDICATMYFFDNTKDARTTITALIDYYKAAGYKTLPDVFVRANFTKYQQKSKILDDPEKSNSAQWKEQTKRSVLVLEINGEISIFPSNMTSASEVKILKKIE